MIGQPAPIRRLMAAMPMLLCGIHLACADAVVPSLPNRPLDSRVSEPDVIKQLQNRLDQVATGAASACETEYQTNKAQAWLNFAKYAYHERAASNVQRAAIHNTDGIVKGLESGAGSSNETPELPTARHQRDDLWRAVSTAKGDGRLCGAPKMMAYCEVQLAWVDYEAAAGGWRHVDPYMRIAEDYCAIALNAAPVVSPTPAQAETPLPFEAPPSAPPAELPRSVQIDEPATTKTAPIEPFAVVLFPHNRARRMDIRSPGKPVLAHFAAQLKSLPADTQIDVVGHADKTGHRRYNEALSARRARNVAILLERLGVKPQQIHVSAAGSADPVVKCTAPRSPADRRRYLACLEPNRGVVVRLRDSPE